ncbi:MAG: hypothetical protein AAB381_03055 [Patescibacteria group bacterium]
MKINTTQATKSDLLDYVTKFEFSEFRTEVSDRFDSVDSRLDSLDKRVDNLDRKIDSIREEFRVHTGVLLQQSRDYFDTAMEYMKGIGENKADKKDFEVLEMKVERLIEG